ncbi:MAG: hypothetical protein KGM87_15705, partial [Betaproteobacteria bacterium]|nr:hypothetical protein [Betaproteobacteria bacterium]
ALHALRERVDQRRAEVLQRLARLLDGDTQASGDAATRDAAAQVRILMFIDKFRRDLAPRGARKTSTPAA